MPFSGFLFRQIAQNQHKLDGVGNKAFLIVYFLGNISIRSRQNRRMFVKVIARQMHEHFLRLGVLRVSGNIFQWRRRFPFLAVL